MSSPGAVVANVAPPRSDPSSSWSVIMLAIVALSMLLPASGVVGGGATASLSHPLSPVASSSHTSVHATSPILHSGALSLPNAPSAPARTGSALDLLHHPPEVTFSRSPGLVGTHGVAPPGAQALLQRLPAPAGSASGGSADLPSSVSSLYQWCYGLWPSSGQSSYQNGCYGHD
ncbi:MAG: hypothetical protein KGJ23_16580, partial [Euryarchaeota archaeon]|nr:hypothetical protein [Euryarchaeota archaeon]